MPFVSSPFSAVPKGLLAIALALGLTIPGVILVAQGTQSGDDVVTLQPEGFRAHRTAARKPEGKGT